MKGHKCKLISQAINGDGTEFECSKCRKRGEFKDGVYYCGKCKYNVHEKCANHFD